MTVVAFDLGLATTGVCWGPHDHDHHILPAALRRSPMTDETRQARLAWWRATFAMILLPHDRPDVYVEAPYMSPKHPKGAVELIKLHGVLAAVCATNHLELITVENRTLKKWATGNGNAAKAEMDRSAVQLGYIIDDDNEADAIHLWRYAHADDISQGVTA